MAKSKDPAFLFYASDFMMGTTFFSNEQVGKYIRLLCAQHQHGGMIDKNSFCSLVGDDQMIRSKFVECEHGFYNERLAQEMERRQKKSGNISKAAKETWEKRKSDNDYNTIVIQSYNKSNGIVIRPENENEKVLEYKYDKGTLMPKMVEIFKSAYPYYPVDESVDFPACLNISYKIAKQKGWTKDSVLKENMAAVLEAWGKIVQFSTNDKWYSTRSIPDFNTEFQRIVQGMTQAGRQQKPKEVERTQPSAPSLKILNHD